MKRGSRGSLFQDPKKRESIAFLTDYDICNPSALLAFPEQSKSKHKSSFAPTHLKSAYSTFDLKGSQPSLRESKSFAPSRSISMSHLSLASNPMTTPMKKGAFHPNQVMETPKATGMVDPRQIREKEFLNASARVVYTFLAGNGYPNPITIKAIGKPELSTQEILHVFTFLLSFIGADLGDGNELPVKEDIPNALADIGYPFTIKKSTISAMNTNHNWPTMLAALRWTVELLDPLLGYDIGLDNLFPPDSSFLDEDFRSRDALRDELIRTSQMFQCKDEPEILESFARERDEYYRESLASIREEREGLMKERDQLAGSVTQKEKDTLAVLQGIYNDRNDEFFTYDQEGKALSANILDKKGTTSKSNQKLIEVQKEISEFKRKYERVSTQIECQVINMADAIEMKEETKSNRVEIDRQRTTISSYNDTLVHLRMQLSKQMGKIRPLMSEVNLALKEITFRFQGCHNGLADQLGIDDVITTSEHLSKAIQNNLSVLQQLKGMETGAISKIKQDSLEMRNSVQSLETSVHGAELKVSEIGHEIELQQEMNEELQRKTMELKERKTAEKNKRFDELYELRRSCEESNLGVIQLESQRDQVISAGREENKKIHEDLNQLASKVEDVASQILKLLKAREGIVAKLGRFYEEYKAKFTIDSE